MLIRDLTRFANDLDASGLKKEADIVDVIITKIAGPSFGPTRVTFDPLSGSTKLNRPVSPAGGTGTGGTALTVLAPIAIGTAAGGALGVELNYQIMRRAHPNLTRSEVLGLAKLTYAYLTGGEKGAWQEWDRQERIAGRPGMTWAEFQAEKAGELGDYLEDTAAKIEAAASPNPGTISPVRTEGSVDDHESASTLWHKGKSAFDNKDYHTAVAMWREAYALSGEEKILYDTAEAYYKMNKTQKAIETLGKIPAGIKFTDYGISTNIEDQIKSLRQNMGWIEGATQ